MCNLINTHTHTHIHTHIDTHYKALLKPRECNERNRTIAVGNNLYPMIVVPLFRQIPHREYREAGID